METWSVEENKALVEYVLFHVGDPDTWPSHSKRSKFWKEAAEFVQQRSKALTKRSGKKEKLIYDDSICIVLIYLVQAWSQLYRIEW